MTYLEEAALTTVERSRTSRAPATPAGPAGKPQNTQVGGATADDDALFRFPAPDDPAPATRRLLGMSLHAAALGLTGVAVGVRALVVALGGTAFWFLPVLALLSLISVAAAVGAFLSIHRPALPWLLLAGASAPMAGAALLALAY
jgi:hypothetical protein